MKVLSSFRSFITAHAGKLSLGYLFNDHCTAESCYHCCDNYESSITGRGRSAAGRLVVGLCLGSGSSLGYDLGYYGGLTLIVGYNFLNDLGSSLGGSGSCGSSGSLALIICGRSSVVIAAEVVLKVSDYDIVKG